MWNREYKEITQIRSVERRGCICKRYYEPVLMNRKII